MRLTSHCSKHFTFQQLTQCSQTQQLIGLENGPQQPGTWFALEQLAKQILDPVAEQFGTLTLTYGFCSHELAKQIKKNASPRIAPELDQHASFELNSKGNRICERGGAACDFTAQTLQTRMSEIALWISQRLPYDRIYYYGNSNPLHVSWAANPSQQIVTMKTYSSEKRIPKIITADKLETIDW